MAAQSLQNPGGGEGDQEVSYEDLLYMMELIKQHRQQQARPAPNYWDMVYGAGRRAVNRVRDLLPGQYGAEF